MVVCWGAGALRPERVEGFDGATSLAVGSGRTCVVRAGGAWCRQLGTGHAVVALPPLPGVVQVIESGSEDVYGLDASGGVWRWELIANDDFRAPVRVPFGRVSAACFQVPLAFGVRAVVDGAVWAQSNTSAAGPVERVTALGAGVRALACGALTACAQDGAGAVACVSSSGRAVAAPELRGATVISATGSWACGVVGGALYCDARRVEGADGAELLATITSRGGCARAARGVVVCWGANDRGQLGDGTTTARETAAPVAW